MTASGGSRAPCWSVPGILAVGIDPGSGLSFYPTRPPPSWPTCSTSIVIVEMLIILVHVVLVSALARFSTTRALIVITISCGQCPDRGMHASAAFRILLWSVPSGARGEQYRARHWSRAFHPANALVPRIDFLLADRSPVERRLPEQALLSLLLTRPYSAEEHRDHSRPASFCNFLINGKRVVGFTHTEGPPQSGAASSRGRGPRAIDFRIERYLPDRVDYVVNLPTRTTLVFNEMYFPGWGARVDNGGPRCR